MEGQTTTSPPERAGPSSEDAKTTPSASTGKVEGVVKSQGPVSDEKGAFFNLSVEKSPFDEEGYLKQGADFSDMEKVAGVYNRAQENAQMVTGTAKQVVPAGTRTVGERFLNSETVERPLKELAATRGDMDELSNPDHMTIGFLKPATRLIDFIIMYNLNITLLH